MEKAVHETICRVMENSIEYKTTNLDPTDIAGLDVYKRQVSLYTEEDWQSESSGMSASEPQTGDRMVQSEGQTSGEICVYVCGAVQKPGVFRLPAGSRVFEAIEQAGGLREDAAFSAVNQAAVLEDGTQVTVPTQEEVKAGAADGAWNPSEDVYKRQGLHSGTDHLVCAGKSGHPAQKRASEQGEGVRGHSTEDQAGYECYQRGGHCTAGSGQGYRCV